MCKNILKHFSYNKKQTDPKSNLVIDHDENIFPGDGSVMGPGYHPSQEKKPTTVYKHKPQ